MATLKGGEFLIKEIPANEIFSIEELNEEQKCFVIQQKNL